MGLLSKIFGFKQRGNKHDNTPTASYPEEYLQILKFISTLDSLLNDDRFIARSDYKQLVDEYASLPAFIETLKIKVAKDNKKVIIITIVLFIFIHLLKHIFLVLTVLV